MNKTEVQSRVLQNGKPLSLDKFEWDEEARNFKSFENRLVIDFSDVHYCTFTTGEDCTFKAGGNCTFTTGDNCTFKTGDNCTFKTGGGCTFKTGGVTFTCPPLIFNGSRYSIGFLAPGVVKSGCIEMSIQWWEEHIRRCAEEHEYTPEQIDEYEWYVKTLASWMKFRGVYEPKNK